MDELNQNTNTNIEEQAQEPDAIDIINDLRANTVSKAEYEKLKAQNSKLMQSLANGETLPAEAAKPSKEELRKALYANEGKPLSNLEYVKKTLELRQAILDDNGVDPFVPNGSMITPTAEDFAAANRVAQVFQECVDYAQGDSNVFTNELQRRTRDVRITRR